MPRDKTFTAPQEPLTAFAAGLDRALSAFTTGEAASAKAMQAISASVTAALDGAEKARAHVAASGARALEDQIAAASAFAQVKTPQEAFQLQTQFARRALEAYTADVTAFGGLVSASFQQSLKPLTDRLHSDS
jgi:hypothetical protein